MKKIAFLYLITIIVGFVVVSCGLEDKLLNNTISVAIEPGSIGFIRHNSSQTFTAIVRDARGKLMDVDVNWSISGFSSDVKISNNVGKSVVFETSNSNGDSTGILTAEYSGVRRSVEIEVTNDLILYRNGQWGSIIDREALNSCLYLPEYIRMRETEDDGTCLEFTVTPPPESGYLPDFHLRFQPPQDLSSYNSLQFSAKCDNTESTFTFNLTMIKNVGQGGYEETIPTFASPEWGVLINALPVSKDTVDYPFSIQFQYGDFHDGQPRTLRINNIRFIE